MFSTIYIGVSFIVQITPAHDPNDFEVGRRHNLEFINIFTDDGKINSNGSSKFVGMPRFKARQAVTEKLKEEVCHNSLPIHVSCVFWNFKLSKHVMPDGMKVLWP